MKIRLLKTHSHNDDLFPAGSLLSIDDEQAKWLIEQGVAEQFTGSLPQRATQPEPRKRTVRSCCGW